MIIEKKIDDNEVQADIRHMVEFFNKNQTSGQRITISTCEKKRTKKLDEKDYERTLAGKDVLDLLEVEGDKLTEDIDIVDVTRDWMVQQNSLQVDVLKGIFDKKTYQKKKYDYSQVEAVLAFKLNPSKINYPTPEDVINKVIVQSDIKKIEDDDNKKIFDMVQIIMNSRFQLKNVKCLKKIYQFNEGTVICLTSPSKCWEPLYWDKWEQVQETQKKGWFGKRK